MAETHYEDYPTGTPRSPARRTGLWVLAAILLCALFTAVFEYFVRTDTGQLAEYAMIDAATHRVSSLSARGVNVGWVQSLMVIIPAALFILLTILRRVFLSALIAAITVLGANVTTQLLKNVILERPDLANGVPDWAGNSLPSGHTTFAASLAVAVFLVSGPRQRPLIGLLTAVYASGVGAYVFTETWHRPSDVIAAYLVVAIWGTVGGWLAMRVEPVRNSVTLDRPANAAGPAVLCLLLGLALTAGSALTFALGGTLEAGESGGVWHWCAGLLLSIGPSFLIGGAGIMFFHAESGRRHRGGRGPQDLQEARYPIPPELAELYTV